MVWVSTYRIQIISAFIFATGHYHTGSARHFSTQKYGSQYMLLIFEASFILKSKFTYFSSWRPAVLNFTILPSRYSAGTHFTQFATELLRTGTFSKLAYLTGSSYLRYINNPTTSYFACKNRGPALYPGFGISTTPNICPHDQDLTRNFGHMTTFGTVDDPTLLVPVLVQYWYWRY